MFSFTIPSKIIKYLGITYLRKQEICTPKTQDAGERKQRWHKQMERYTMFLDWKDQYCQNEYTTQDNLQIWCNPYQITNGIFHRIRTKKKS